MFFINNKLIIVIIFFITYCSGSLKVISVIDTDNDREISPELVKEYKVARYSRFIGEFTNADCEQNPLVGRIVKLDEEYDNVCDEIFLRRGDLKGNIVVLDQVTSSKFSVFCFVLLF